MIYARFIFIAFLVLTIAYYIMIVGQLFGFWKVTLKKISFSKLIIPFYYWMGK